MQETHSAEEAGFVGDEDCETGEEVGGGRAQGMEV